MDESSGEASSQNGGKKQKKEKRKFDISLPAQHLVSKSFSDQVIQQWLILYHHFYSLVVFR